MRKIRCRRGGRAPLAGFQCGAELYLALFFPRASKAFSSFDFTTTTTHDKKTQAQVISNWSSTNTRLSFSPQALFNHAPKFTNKLRLHFTHFTTSSQQPASNMTLPADPTQTLHIDTVLSEDLNEQHAASEISPNQDSVMNTKMKGTNAAASTDIKDEEAVTDAPSRASFLGLPAEMRLRIYDYLLDASRRPASELDRNSPDGSGWHCCFLRTRKNMMCGCAKTVHPSILCVSRLIHQEATPILYSTVEARIKTQSPMDCTNTKAYYDLTRLWKLLPSNEAHVSSITSLVLATDMSDVPVRIDENEDFLDALKPLWSELKSRLYSLKNFRLHFSMDGNEYDIDFFDFDEILGMLALPKLEKLTLEVFVSSPLCQGPDGDHTVHAQLDAFEFLNTLQQKAKAKIVESGKNVEVVGLLRQAKCKRHPQDFADWSDNGSMSGASDELAAEYEEDWATEAEWISDEDWSSDYDDISDEDGSNDDEGSNDEDGSSDEDGVSGEGGTANEEAATVEEGMIDKEVVVNEDDE